MESLVKGVLMDRTSAVQVSTRPNVGYNRITMKKASNSGAGTAKTLPATVSQPSISLKDRFICYITGENEEDRLIRTTLTAYLNVLQQELIMTERARIQHYEGGGRLRHDFEKQALRLQRWGLLQILPAFQMQAWLRVARAQLIVEMGSRC
jgi:hypothetical protein